MTAVAACTAAAAPFGMAFAGAWLTRSLLPAMPRVAMAIADLRLRVSGGQNRVRFIAPERVGRGARGPIRLKSFDRLDGGKALTMAVTIAREGSDKPAGVVGTVSRSFI